MLHFHFIVNVLTSGTKSMKFCCTNIIAVRKFFVSFFDTMSRYCTCTITMVRSGNQKYTCKRHVSPIIKERNFGHNIVRKFGGIQEFFINRKIKKENEGNENKIAVILYTESVGQLHNSIHYPLYVRYWHKIHDQNGRYC